MTFKEAVKIIYDNNEKQKTSVYNEAASKIKWYENNVLELEDYETDELYEVLEYMNEKETNNEIKLTSEQLEFLGKELATIMRIVTTQRDLINFLPDPRQGNAEKNALHYISIHSALSNTFDLYNDIILKLDNYSLVIENSTDKEIIKEYSKNTF